MENILTDSPPRSGDATEETDGARSHRPASSGKKRVYPFVIAALLVAIAAAVYFRSSSKTKAGGAVALALVQKRDLEILVLEGGNVKALESLELKNQISSREGVKILSIVEEGYEVTDQDVKEEKVLIKLDPTETKERIEEHDIEFEASQANLTKDDEARAIQATESQKEINVARQTARFALLDLEKYLGEKASRLVLSERKLPADEDSLMDYEEGFRDRLLAGTPVAEKDEDDPESNEDESAASSERIISRQDWKRIDFSTFLKRELLGDGEAQQELRKREDELLVAQSELAVETETILGSERLAERDFITKVTLDKQRVALKKATIKELSATTQLELYRRYEFPKKAEELLTKYEDALHVLDQEKEEALAKLAQAEANYKSSEQMFKMAKKKRDELQEQLDSCVITATKPGLVVYGSSERSYYSSEEKVEEGAAIRFKRTIITIPDMTRMGVKVSIRESHVKKVKVDQKVRIVTDAEPDKILDGIVKKVAVLPDSNSWFSNPNQKVYTTEIHIDGNHDWLKPGMSAKVEIITDQLTGALCAPLQSVTVEGKETVVYYDDGGKAVRQIVETGKFNDEFIEIKNGLSEGQSVYLTKPGYEDAQEASAEET